jgi:hypothetical protein
MRDHVDARLTAAFQDVPVPEGLAERLLDRLESGDPRFVDANAETVPLSLPRTPGQSRRLRRWFLAGAALATAAGLLIAIGLNTPRQTPISRECVLEEAIQAFAGGFQGTGFLVSERASPADYPFSPLVRCLPWTRWRHLETFLGRPGVVYELSGNAALYVVARENVEGIDCAPPMTPFTTAQCCASAWQDGGLLYVLVVRGDPATYKQYLLLPRSPLA